MRISELNNIYDKYGFDKDKDIKETNNSFSELMYGALKDVNKLQLEADKMKEDLVLGEVENLHDVTIAGEKANVALQVSMGIRSKLVEAYKEIMRMQI